MIARAVHPGQHWSADLYFPEDAPQFFKNISKKYPGTSPGQSGAFEQKVKQMETHLGRLRIIQGANRFRIVSREGTKQNPYEHKLLKVVNVAARQSDGSDVVNMPLNDTFKHGLFVTMSDDKTFHYYRWEDIVGKEPGIK